MFEYLMPLLFMQTHENSLLDRACYDAVRCQIVYGRQNGVPWGIKIRLQRDRPTQRLSISSLWCAGTGIEAWAGRQPGGGTLRCGARSWRGTGRSDKESAADCQFGSFDASRRLRLLRSDRLFATQRTRRRDRNHNQLLHGSSPGMSLLAYDNALHENAMRRRFHSDPRVRATEPLLHEHIPEQILPTAGEGHEERPVRQTIPTLGVSTLKQTADLASPRIHLLSNGACSVALTNSGGGYLRWLDLDVTRWRADATCDESGSFCYIRDLENGTTWGNTRQPVRSPELRYTWSFTPDKAEFRRRSGPCETITEIVISAEDNAEVRRVTLVNTSRKTCQLELTTYLELALAPHRTDLAHPAFNKLFIETEWLPGCKALIARRRLRASDDRPVWAAHLFVAEASTGATEFETDRARFLGPGRTLENPEALTRHLTNATGAVLDPIFSLRQRITILPNQRFQFALVTIVADSREAIVALAGRYSEFHTCARAFETAWTRSQLEMRRLRIRRADVQTFQQLAGLIIFPQAQLRPPPARLSRGTEGQRALWRQGISGDLPLVVVMIGHLRDMEVVREILTAHTFWHLRGLKVDLSS